MLSSKNNIKLLYQFQRLLSLNSKSNEKASVGTNTILHSNIHDSPKQNEQATSFRVRELKELGGKIKIGVTHTVVQNEFVKFKVNDRSHPRSSEIYSEIERLTLEMFEHGYKPDSSWVTRQLRKGETVQSVLNSHSERLAIAYHLIQRPAPTFIQIVNNLRMCSDCHQAIKLIAKIRKCSIMVRDANRIHHFQLNGECSCKDYF